MSGQVDADATVALAFTAYENGVKSATPANERIRMQVAPGVPFDLIVHGEITAARLVTIARLLQACAAILAEPPVPVADSPEDSAVED